MLLLFKRFFLRIFFIQIFIKKGFIELINRQIFYLNIVYIIYMIFLFNDCREVILNNDLMHSLYSYSLLQWHKSLSVCTEFLAYACSLLMGLYLHTYQTNKFEYISLYFKFQYEDFSNANF